MTSRNSRLSLQKTDEGTENDRKKRKTTEKGQLQTKLSFTKTTTENDDKTTPTVEAVESYTINGITTLFPFKVLKNLLKAYSSQRALMAKLISALKTKTNALLER